MQKNMPIVLVVVALLIVVVAIAAISAKRTGSGAAASGRAAPAPKYTATVRPTTEKEQAQYTNVLQSALAEARKLYDAKDYNGTLAKTREILDNIDNTSQAAKNLRQLAQLRLIEQRQAAAR